MTPLRRSCACGRLAMAGPWKRRRGKSCGPDCGRNALPGSISRIRSGDISTLLEVWNSRSRHVKLSGVPRDSPNDSSRHERAFGSSQALAFLRGPAVARRPATIGFEQETHARHALAFHRPVAFHGQPPHFFGLLRTRITRVGRKRSCAARWTWTQRVGSPPPCWVS